MAVSDAAHEAVSEQPESQGLAHSPAPAYLWPTHSSTAAAQRRRRRKRAVLVRAAVSRGNPPETLTPQRQVPDDPELARLQERQIQRERDAINDAVLAYRKIGVQRLPATS